MTRVTHLAVMYLDYNYSTTEQFFYTDYIFSLGILTPIPIFAPSNLQKIGKVDKKHVVNTGVFVADRPLFLGDTLLFASLGIHML